MRGMGYEPGEEVPITTPANQYICDCDANRLLVTRTCDDAECTGYTSSGMELNLPAALLSEASIPVGEEVAVLAADGALIIVPSTESRHSALWERMAKYTAAPWILRIFLGKETWNPYWKP